MTKSSSFATQNAIADRRVLRLLLLALLIGVAARTMLWSSYEPTTTPDTGSFVRAARDLVEGDLLQSEGRRPPGYPALIALAGYDYSRVWLLQIICGLASTAVLFLLALRLTGSPAVGFAAATLHTLNLQQLFFEASVMSESLSTLAFLVVTLVFLLLVDKLRENRRSALAIVLGLLSGVTVLIRPQFAFLPLVLPGLLLIHQSPGFDHPLIAARTPIGRI
jgi:4-amino-4-deoxy-L-arabinose transferase-like glycosyltransferase